MYNWRAPVIHRHEQGSGRRSFHRPSAASPGYPCLQIDSRCTIIIVVVRNSMCAKSSRPCCESTGRPFIFTMASTIASHRAAGQIACTHAAAPPAWRVGLISRVCKGAVNLICRPFINHSSFAAYPVAAISTPVSTDHRAFSFLAFSILSTRLKSD